MDAAALSGWMLFVGLTQLVPPEVPPPLLADAHHVFPPREQVQAMQAANYRHREWLAAMATLEPWREAYWWQLHGEALERWCLLDNLADAQAEWYSPAWRLDCLTRYREAVGWARYHAGHVPAGVPEWHPRQP